MKNPNVTRHWTATFRLKFQSRMSSAIRFPVAARPAACRWAGGRVSGTRSAIHAVMTAPSRAMSQKIVRQSPAAMITLPSPGAMTGPIWVMAVSVPNRVARSPPR